MTRPVKDKYFMLMAELVATRSTCLRRAVGCVVVNVRNHVIATGYNGVAAGQLHCNEPNVMANVHGHAEDGYEYTSYPNACLGSNSPSGQNLDGCEAIHAEQNALLQCHNVHEIHTIYTTTAPCLTCIKLLLNTSCCRIVFKEDYPQAEASKKLWGGRLWHQYPRKRSKKPKIDE